MGRRAATFEAVLRTYMLYGEHVCSARRGRGGEGEVRTSWVCALQHVCMAIEGRSGAGGGYSCNDDVVNARILSTVSVQLQLIGINYFWYIDVDILRSLLCPE